MLPLSRELLAAIDKGMESLKQAQQQQQQQQQQQGIDEQGAATDQPHAAATTTVEPLLQQQQREQATFPTVPGQAVGQQHPLRLPRTGTGAGVQGFGSNVIQRRPSAKAMGEGDGSGKPVRRSTYYPPATTQNNTNAGRTGQTTNPAGRNIWL